ncbi:MAG: transposase [Pseudonocardiaceae bacterium]
MVISRRPRSTSTGPGAWPRPLPATCWLRLLCLDGPLAKAEPTTLRYRLLHTAARIVRGQRTRKITIPQTWPWATHLLACFHAISALPRPG